MAKRTYIREQDKKYMTQHNAGNPNLIHPAPEKDDVIPYDNLGKSDKDPYTSDLRRIVSKWNRLDPEKDIKIHAGIDPETGKQRHYKVAQKDVDWNTFRENEEFERKNKALKKLERDENDSAKYKYILARHDGLPPEADPDVQMNESEHFATQPTASKAASVSRSRYREASNDLAMKFRRSRAKIAQAYKVLTTMTDDPLEYKNKLYELEKEPNIVKGGAIGGVEILGERPIDEARKLIVAGKVPEEIAYKVKQSPYNEDLEIDKKPRNPTQDLLKDTETFIKWDDEREAKKQEALLKKLQGGGRRGRPPARKQTVDESLKKLNSIMQPLVAQAKEKLARAQTVFEKEDAQLTLDMLVNSYRTAVDKLRSLSRIGTIVSPSSDVNEISDVAGGVDDGAAIIAAKKEREALNNKVLAERVELQRQKEERLRKDEENRKRQIAARKIGHF